MKGTERRKWTVGDVFLILLAVLSALGFLLRFWGISKRGEEELREYEILAEWKHAEVRTVEGLREGDALYTASGELFGRVITVEQIPSTVEIKKDGRIYRVESTDRLDVRMVVSVTAREADGQILRAGREALMVGQTLCLYSMTLEIPVRIAFVGEKGAF